MRIRVKVSSGLELLFRDGGVEIMANKENESIEPSMDQIAEEGGGFQLLILPKIESVPAAAKKWKMLTDAGLDPEEMAECLYHYCGGTKEQRRVGLKAARNFRKEIKPAADEIRKAADTTERILGDLEKVGGIKFHVPDFKRLPSIQRDFAAELEWLAPILTNNVAQGVRTEKNGWLTSRAHGEALSKLVYMVREVTSKPFADIAP